MVRTKGSLSPAALLAAGLSFLLGASAWGADAKQIYDVNCTSCHGAGGKGDGAVGKFLNPKPGDFATVLKDRKDADIAKIISEGGAAVGKAASMPAYKGKLSEEDIQALVDYVKSFGAK